MTDRRKELKEQYRQMKPDMGIFILRSSLSNKCYIEGTQNLKAALNKNIFQLKMGAHPIKELQREWKELGEGSFTINTLEKLDYDKDETKTDYTDDLALLLMEWEDRLREEKLKLYKK